MTDGNAGFFSEIGGNLKNLELTGEIISTGNNCGVFAYRPTGGFIENCISRVNITSSGDYVAGIAGGEWSSRISNCQNYGDIKGANFVSGVSSTWGKIENCKNYGNVTGNNYIGGINGQYGNVSKCENYGKIVALDGNVGGISGRAGTQPIDNCINYGKVETNRRKCRRNSRSLGREML